MPMFDITYPEIVIILILKEFIYNFNTYPYLKEVGQSNGCLSRGNQVQVVRSGEDLNKNWNPHLQLVLWQVNLGKKLIFVIVALRDRLRMLKSLKL